MRLPFLRRKKTEKRANIHSRLDKVRKGAEDACESREVSNLVKGLAEGDG
jgi:hypothetical protein